MRGDILVKMDQPLGIPSEKIHTPLHMVQQVPHEKGVFRITMAGEAWKDMLGKVLDNLSDYSTETKHKFGFFINF